MKLSSSFIRAHAKGFGAGVATIAAAASFGMTAFAADGSYHSSSNSSSDDHFRAVAASMHQFFDRDDGYFRSMGEHLLESFQERHGKDSSAHATIAVNSISSSSDSSTTSADAQNTPLDAILTALSASTSATTTDASASTTASTGTTATVTPIIVGISTSTSATSTGTTMTEEPATTTVAADTASSTASSTDTTASSTSDTTGQSSTPSSSGSAGSSSVPSGHGMVSLNFDDGWVSAFNDAVPILKADGLTGTFYIITSYADQGFSGFMTWDDITGLAAAGNEIGDHTVDHPHMLTLSAAAQQSEINDAENDLMSHGLNPITFAYPYGETNAALDDKVKSDGFSSARGTGGCINGSDTNVYDLCADSLTTQTTFADVKANIDKAIASNGWYIITIHRVNETSSGDLYDVSSDLVQQIADYLKQTGVPVVTNSQGVANMSALDTESSISNAKTSTE